MLHPNLQVVNSSQVKFGMMVGHSKKKLVVMKLFLTFIILPHTTAAVDPEQFLVSKNSPKNQTLISLPKDFRNSGDRDDCCALVLFIEDLPIRDHGSGMTESGQVTFKFYHPQIHDNPNIFTMDYHEKVKTRHIVEFDKCASMNEVTFDIHATSTIMEEKEVKIVILKGRDENITCKIVPPPESQKIVTLIIVIVVSWVITILAVTICIVMCCKYDVPQAIYQRYQQVSTSDEIQMPKIPSQDDGIHPERAELPENGRGVNKNTDNTGNAETENDENFLGADDASPTVDLYKDTKESSGGVVDVTNAAGSSKGEISRGNSQEDRGIVKGGKRPRGPPRGPPKEEGSTTLSPSNENNGFCEQIAYFAKLIKENTPLLVASVAACLFFLASVIATIICVFLFPSK